MTTQPATRALRTAARTGFTLIELMVAISVMAILVMVAAPYFQDFIMNVRLTGQANDLMTDLMLARSEATKRNVPVSVCATSAASCSGTSDWRAGWMVVIDADSNGQPDAGTRPLKIADSISGANSLQKVTAGASPITFTPTGRVATSATTLRICDNRDKGRAVRVTVTGRASVTKLEGGCAATQE